MCGIGDEGPSSTNNGRGEHVDNREDQLADDEILSIDDDYVDLVENMDQMMKDAEVNNDDEVTDRDYAKFRDLVWDSKKPLYDGQQLHLVGCRPETSEAKGKQLLVRSELHRLGSTVKGDASNGECVARKHL